nr:OSJNBb0015C06.3 [Oryza sativa Japonica Group]
MANYLPVALADSARSWLHGLPRGTIGSWAEFHDHFIANFQGTFERPGTQFDLYNVIQKSRESLRDYIRRFSEQRNKISDITGNVIIAAFTKGIRHELLVGKFGFKPPKTVKQMFEKANEYAKAEDAVIASKQSGSTWKPKKDVPTTGGVEFTEQYAKNARKTTDGDQSTSKKKDDEDDASTSFQDSRKELNHMFGGPLAYESKRKQKLTEREINAVQPDTPQYLQWSETAIKFDHSDHPDRVVHPGRALNILFAKTLDDMQIPWTELKPSSAPFHGVIPGLSSTPLSQITLPVTFGTRENFRTENICFEVADFETAYHAILGRPALPKFMAVPHYTYMMMKMPGPRGVISLRSDIKQAVTCDKESCEMAQTREITLAREEIRLAASIATEEEVPATKMPKSGEGDAKTKAEYQITLPVAFGSRENFRTENICFEVADFETAYHAILRRPALPKFMAVPHYTYMMMKMPGPRGVISLRSDIKQVVTCDKESCEMAQTRKITLAREEIRLAASIATEEEVLATKMPKSGEGDAKTKKNPLDPSYPTKTADRKDAIKEELTKLLAAGFTKEVLHPDWLANPVLVRKKTAQWRMCVDYTDLNKSCPKDPFGLPRIDQIGRNVEAYVDDVVVKTKQKNNLIADLKETFASIRAFRMKLNPEKCIFGVSSGKLLGFMVSHRGIQANPEKINAILNMKPPSSQKDIQKLTGCMVALSRFISRLGERGMRFFKLLKKTDNFQWGPEAQKAFEDFKKLLTTPPVLASPHLQEPLLLYVSATFQVVSTVMVVEREEDGHVYFVSEVLTNSKTRYHQVQKLLYGVLITVRKLSHYFQGHSVTVVTSFPLGDILHNGEANGRIAKWALELMSLDLSFKPRTSIKSQALADFVAEWTECQEDMPLEKMEYWTMHFDGSKRLSGTGAGVVLISPTGERLNYVLWIHFSASHNMAEYEALLHGLRIAISLGIRHLIVRGDSQLVVNQVMKEWSCLDDNMAAYRLEVRKLEDKFDGLELTHVLRHNNEAADRLANFGSKREITPSDVFVEHFYEPTVPRKETTEAVDTQETHLPTQELQTIPLSWSFAVWGLDMVGPFKRATGGFTHLFVAINKFSKWIEAKPVVTITADKARDFFINIVHRFGVPNRIITDNGTQFTSSVFKDFCEDFGIKICYASVAHPMSNGQVERANGMVLQGIKARVFDRLHPYAAKWVDQLPSVLWSLRTTPSRATGQSPFFLVYGAEAMLSSEVEFESLRFLNFKEERYGED